MRSDKLDVAEHFADDIQLVERDFLRRVVGIVGNNLYARWSGRAQQLQALDDNAFE